MEEICEKKKCTACAACLNVCPKGAIRMVEEGAAGYLYPAIDPVLCIDCGLCAKTCPVNHPVELRTPLRACAAVSRDEADLMSSASGGASSLLAQETLRRGGIVYGCAMESYRDIRHVRIDRAEDAWKIKGSKYVQSRIGEIYKQVRADLQAGREVMFSGTPCQVAGLRNYLRKAYPNLLLVDLVCHGVPSQKLLRDNVERVLAESGVAGGNYQVTFRRKGRQTSDLRYGVFLAEDAIPVVNGRWVDFPSNDYIAAFMAGLIFRENCFTCPYARPERGSDITVADFWGLQPCSVPKGCGVSLMLTSTEKGEKLLDAVREKALMEERPVAEAVRGNGQLQVPSRRPKERDAFLAEYASSPEQAYRKHLRRYRREQRVRKVKGSVIEAIRHIPIVGTAARRIWRKLRHRA